MGNSASRRSQISYIHLVNNTDVNIRVIVYEIDEFDWQSDEFRPDANLNDITIPAGQSVKRKTIASERSTSAMYTMKMIFPRGLFFLWRIDQHCALNGTIEILHSDSDENLQRCRAEGNVNVVNVIAARDSVNVEAPEVTRGEIAYVGSARDKYVCVPSCRSATLTIRIEKKKVAAAATVAAAEATAQSNC